MYLTNYLGVNQTKDIVIGGEGALLAGRLKDGECMSQSDYIFCTATRRGCYKGKCGFRKVSSRREGASAIKNKKISSDWSEGTLHLFYKPK